MRIGILTSGGDCPGINATIRGVCKTAINYYGMEVVGIHSGFQGLLTKDVESITDKSLSGLLNLGGEESTIIPLSVTMKISENVFLSKHTKKSNLM